MLLPLQLWWYGRDLASPRAEARRTAVAKLTGLRPFGEPRVVERLAAALADADADVQEDAARALMQHGAIDALLRGLPRARPETRRQAVHGFAQRGEIEPLVRLYDLGEREVVMRAVLDLGALVPFMLAYVLRRPMQGQRGKYDPLDVLCQLGAVDALAQIVEGSVSLDFPDQRGDVQAMARVRTEAAGVRQGAVFVLGRMGDRRAVPSLLAMLRGNDLDTRLTAMSQLAAMRELRAVESISSLLSDESWRVREDAAHALGEIGDASAVQALTAYLLNCDPNRQTTECRCAADALAKLKAAEPLLAALARVPAARLPDVVSALGSLSDPRAVEPLTALFTKEYAAIASVSRDDIIWRNTPDLARRIATVAETALALGRIGDPRAFPLLLGALQSQADHVRWCAAVALGNTGDLRAAVPLISMLSNDDGAAGGLKSLNAAARRAAAVHATAEELQRIAALPAQVTYQYYERSDDHLGGMVDAVVDVGNLRRVAQEELDARRQSTGEALVICRPCGARIRVKAQNVGKTARCPGCQRPLVLTPVADKGAG